MGMKMRKIIYGGPGKQVLAIPDHFVALGFKHDMATADNPGLAKLIDGRYKVLAGTLYPSNGANAIGVILNDYDVTFGSEMMAVVVHGYIKTAALPVIPTVAAIAKLKQISFVPLSAMGVSVTANVTNIAVAEAADVEHTVDVVIDNASFGDEAVDPANWTFVGESTTKVEVISVELDERKTVATITTRNSAVTVAGNVTAVPKALAISTGEVPAAAVTIITVA